MSITPDIIKAEAKRLFPAMLAFRRHLHQHPELSFREFETTAFIKQFLADHTIPVSGDLLPTGITGTLEGNTKGTKTIAARADIDALPIHENTGLSFASKNAGIMHACGHDVHSACLMGALLIMQQLRKHWDGQLTYIFQPGEEVLPGGASLLIEKGVLETPAVSTIVGQHVFPELVAGKVGFRAGNYMASTDELHITITGKGGHGALPHRTADPVYAAAQVVVNLQSIVSRNAPAGIPSVLSIGKFIAEGATNVIPETVALAGTFRTMDENWRRQAHQRIEEIITHTAEGLGCKAEIQLLKGYPVLYNDPELTAFCKSEAIQFLGAENVVDLEVRMTAEDFAWYSQQVPGCFYRLGTAGPDASCSHSVHSPLFSIDETALETGMGLMAWLLFKQMENH